MSKITLTQEGEKRLACFGSHLQKSIFLLHIEPYVGSGMRIVPHIRARTPKFGKPTWGLLAQESCEHLRPPGALLGGKSLLDMNTKMSQPCAAPSMIPGRSSS